MSNEKPYYPEDIRAKHRCFGCEQLKNELTDAEATIKHLRGKAEFDMPTDMEGRFHNGACTEPCDTIDGPCACGATHNAKEWLEKLNKRIRQI